MIISLTAWSLPVRLSEFPRVGIDGCFVYCFYNNLIERGGQIIYIGSSSAVHSRMRSHYTSEKFGDPFVRYKMFVPGYHLSTEYRLINKLKPIFNSQHIVFKSIEEKREWIKRGHAYRHGGRWAHKRAASVTSIVGGSREFSHG